MKILHLTMSFSLLLSLALTMSSCEQGYEYRYILLNNTDSIITINLKAKFLDTSILIKPKEAKEVYKTDHGIEGTGGPFPEDIRKDFQRIVVKKCAGMLSLNYLNNALWKFEKKTDFMAIYKTAVQKDSL